MIGLSQVIPILEATLPLLSDALIAYNKKGHTHGHLAVLLQKAVMALETHIDRCHGSDCIGGSND